MRNTLAIPAPMPITVADMLTLTNLEAGWRGITNLAGLETDTNLRQLEVSGNQLATFAVIPALTNLSELRCSWNHILDGTPLAGLTNLVVLDFGANRDANDWNLALTNVTWLPTFTKLKNLGLYYINTPDLSLLAGLTGLTNLTYVNISQNPLADWAVLSSLPNLGALEISGLNLYDLRPLPAFHLRRLVANDNFITNLSPVWSQTGLGDLQVANNTLVTIAPLAIAQSLYYVNLRNNLLDVSQPTNPTLLVIQTLQPGGACYQLQPGDQPISARGPHRTHLS